MRMVPPRKSVSMIFRMARAGRACIAATLALACAGPIRAQGQTLTTLYSFQSPANSASLSNGLILRGGSLYGSSNIGGAQGNGEVFSLRPPAGGTGPWTLRVIYSFTATDGPGPVSNLLFDKTGHIYGATYPSTSAGNIFMLTPPAVAGGPWTESTLFSFPIGGLSGANPVGDMVLDAAGNLFGVTSLGGQFGNGVVYELSPPAVAGGNWTETVLHAFRTLEGVNPVTLSHDLSGPLFGICSNGGSAGVGTVWRLFPPTVSGGTWSFRILHTFAGGSDGANPSGMMIFKGVKYGTTSAGGQFGYGTAFNIVFAGGVFTTSTIYSFAGSGDGIGPVANLVADPLYNLYGVTTSGGAFNAGTIYELTPPAIPGGTWTELVRYSFAGLSDGSQPMGRLALDSTSNLYGTTWLGVGGATNSSTVFELAP